jgi:hypothetical protein
MAKSGHAGALFCLRCLRRCSCDAARGARANDGALRARQEQAQLALAGAPPEMDASSVSGASPRVATLPGEVAFGGGLGAADDAPGAAADAEAGRAVHAVLGEELECWRGRCAALEVEVDGLHGRCRGLEAELEERGARCAALEGELAALLPRLAASVSQAAALADARDATAALEQQLQVRLGRSAHAGACACDAASCHRLHPKFSTVLRKADESRAPAAPFGRARAAKHAGACKPARRCPFQAALERGAAEAGAAADAYAHLEAELAAERVRAAQLVDELAGARGSGAEAQASRAALPTADEAVDDGPDAQLAQKTALVAQLEVGRRHERSSPGPTCYLPSPARCGAGRFCGRGEGGSFKLLQLVEQRVGAASQARLRASTASTAPRLL